MTENDWRLRLPDFSDPEKYESDGWVKTAIYDVPVKNGEGQGLCSFGTTPLLEKLGTLTIYENESLELNAAVFDIFDQGKVYLEWIKEPIKKNTPPAQALKINGKWRVKQLGESFEQFDEIKKINGKEIIWKTTMYFFKTFRGSKEISVKLEIIREDSE